jgi:hypothetical protein
MSKETIVIALGVWVVVLTQLGIPYHPWGVGLFVLTGVGLATIGFLLRGETLGRGRISGEALPRSKRTSFVENAAPPAEVDTEAEHYEHKEGINSLN